MTDRQLASARRDRTGKLNALYAANGEQAPFPPVKFPAPSGCRKALSGCLCLFGVIVLAAFASLLVAAAVDSIIHFL